ncbi:hypothetical protein [Bacillus sp. CH30_1T]|uniref:hypothetical protein n=1 Tax=Bacillus sp. CH30_1T TaxID=2604836 RepID=UPI00165EA113|nr:hypothetical protein [Bacillus sp. CH30_1T]
MKNGNRKSRKRIGRLNFKGIIINKEETREKGMISQLLFASDREEEIDINLLDIIGGIIHA